MSASRALHVTVYRGSDTVLQRTFTEPSVTIGSSHSAVLALTDSSVAPLHCVVTLDEEGITVLDLHSDTGVVVDGSRVLRASLKDGSMFFLGMLRFEVRTVQIHASPEDDDTEDVEITDTVMGPGFVWNGKNEGSGTPATRVLEVHQLWGQTLIDTRHFNATHQEVTLGTDIGHRWHVLGVDMGWVPSPMQHVLPYTPPVWSEVHSSWKNDFYADPGHLPEGRHTLFIREDDGWFALVPTHWDGFIDIGSRRRSLVECVQDGTGVVEGDVIRLQITEDVRFAASIAGVTYVAHWVDRSQRILARPGEETDYPLLGITAMLGFAGLMFGLVVALLPPPAIMEMDEIPERIAELRIERPMKAEPPPKVQAQQEDRGGEKAALPEGRRGEKQSVKKEARGNPPSQKAIADAQIVANAGVFGMMSETGQAAGIFGSSAMNDTLVKDVGGMIGASGTRHGNGGLGDAGDGLGGGGDIASLGTGLGPIGDGPGRHGYGEPGGTKKRGNLRAVGGAIYLGSLDKSLIDRVIKKRMKSLRFCYQRQLATKPGLGGKVVVKFTISKTGSVSSARTTSSTTLSDAAVNSCIINTFKKMQFPQPQGGGVVIVSYPFLFSAG